MTGIQKSNNSNAFFNLIRSPVSFRMFMIKKLPAAFFSGLKMEEINDDKCTVSVPYRWFTKNPFRSTYFACLSMAAEMATGALVLAQTYQRKPPIATLIIAVDSVYHKKAISRTFFTCADGALIKSTVESAVLQKEAQVIKTYSKGLNKEGELVAEFWFTWSLKARNKT